jgi:predicted N-acetyltransferase YhbS
VIVREYRPGDEPRCLAMFDGNFPKFFAPHERELFEKFLRRDDRPFFVAEVDGAVRGCGGFRVDDFGVAFLAWGMVDADWHRRGVGAALLRFRLDRIREIPHAWCVLLDTSQHSAPFFARFGFEAYRTIADGYRPGLDKVFMRRVRGTSER